MTTTNTLAVSGVKSFTNIEGLGFNANLLLNGKKVAYATEPADGGPMHYDWVSKEAESQVAAFIKALPPEPLPADAEDWEKKLYPNGFREHTLDCYVSALVDDYENDRRFARQLKTAVMFVLPEHKKGCYATVKHNGNPEGARAYITNKFPNGVLFTTSAELRTAVAGFSAKPSFTENFQAAAKRSAENFAKTGNPAPTPAQRKAEQTKAQGKKPSGDGLNEMSLAELYATAAFHGVPDCMTRWTHLGTGMQKMQLIQAIRKITNKKA